MKRYNIEWYYNDVYNLKNSLYNIRMNIIKLNRQFNHNFLKKSRFINTPFEDYFLVDNHGNLYNRKTPDSHKALTQIESYLFDNSEASKFTGGPLICRRDMLIHALKYIECDPTEEELNAMRTWLNNDHYLHTLCGTALHPLLVKISEFIPLVDKSLETHDKIREIVKSKTERDYDKVPFNYMDTLIIIRNFMVMYFHEIGFMEKLIHEILSTYVKKKFLDDEVILQYDKHNYKHDIKVAPDKLLANDVLINLKTRDYVRFYNYYTYTSDRLIIIEADVETNDGIIDTIDLDDNFISNMIMSLDKIYNKARENDKHYYNTLYLDLFDNELLFQILQDYMIIERAIKDESENI